MDRREFFRRSIKKATDTVVREVDARVAKKASHWIRPPFAINELEFLLACTRCGDCVDACPHKVVFPLAARLGADVVNTPALDLLNTGCRLCEGWPCVTVCEPGALSIPVEQEDELSNYPVLASVRIDETTCLPFNGPECGVCVDVCPVPGAITLKDDKPVIDDRRCVGCSMCRESCIVEPKAIHVGSVHLGEAGEQ